MMISLGQLAASGELAPSAIKYWATVVEAGGGYTRFALPKRGRREARNVVRASVGLDRTLKQLRVALETAVEFSPAPSVHGFLKGRGILSNALCHLDQDVVLNLDLRNFFGTITAQAVRERLISVGLDDDAASSFARVTTIDELLPQGFCTSPMLSNYVFDPTDIRLEDLAVEMGVNYSRYADDITFSGRRDAVDDSLMQKIREILEEDGWTVNERKTRFMRRGRAQYVTGLSVDDPNGPHVPRVLKRSLRRELYYAGRFGLDDARSHSSRPLSLAQLRGWTEFVSHVEAGRSQQFEDLWGRIAVPVRDHGPSDWDLMLDEISFPSDW